MYVALCFTNNLGGIVMLFTYFFVESFIPKLFIPYNENYSLLYVRIQSSCNQYVILAVWVGVQIFGVETWAIM